MSARRHICVLSFFHAHTGGSMKRVIVGLFTLLVALALKPAVAAGQEATISGHVTSEDGKGLANVSVFITDLGVGSITREDGAYSFVIPGARVTGQSTLIAARRVGFRAKSVRITLRPGVMTQDFVLSPNPM